jgi:hypothetical protein
VTELASAGCRRREHVDYTGRFCKVCGKSELCEGKNLVPNEFPSTPYEIFPPVSSVFLVPLNNVFGKIVSYKDFFFSFIFPAASRILFNLFKPTGHVMHQQVQHSTTVRSAHTVFMCFVFI